MGAGGPSSEEPGESGARAGRIGGESRETSTGGWGGRAVAGRGVVAEWSSERSIEREVARAEKQPLFFRVPQY